MNRMRLSNIIAKPFQRVHKSIKKEEHNQYWLKGGRGSTKSSFVGIEIVLGIIKDPNANAVVFRRYQNELRDTVYGQVEWAINKLGVESYFTCNVSPMQIVYKPTGQKIVFKAADSPGKVKSINLGKGYIKYGWFEECDQFRNYAEIRNIMQSLLRGEGNHKRTVFFTYNPPKSSRSWVNQEVKLSREDRYVHHSTYLDVPPEWLGETFIAEAEHLKKVNEMAYRHEYLGEETGTGLEVFNNVSIRAISDAEIQTFDKIRTGLDWGYSVDPCSVSRMHYDSTRKRLYVFGEIYKINLFNDKLASMIQDKGWNNRVIIADSAEPKSIADLARQGIKIRGAKKGPGSIEHGIKFLQGLEEIIIDDIRCPNAAREFINYSLDIDSRGMVKVNFPDRDNHYIDSVRYGLEDDMKDSKVKTISKSSFGL
ncbi:phage terminase large subunit [Andreesenia angusta]|uniref:Phage terminase large subunit n=2 Tax=Andreesenia angusta TaxID=39480 RepID=A0A1S1V8W9_9FIRM|nr:phage terminase large subunit [Andreesenia angusta]